MIRSHPPAHHRPALILGLTAACASAAELQVLQATLVDPAALNFSEAAASFSQNINGRTFQRSAMSTFRGYQYATYFDADRHVCVARRKLPTGPWEILRLTDYQMQGNDSHNVAALGICHQDGTIHLAFDHHADPLNYRVSLPGVATDPESATWSSALFSPVTDQLGSVGAPSQVTYPAFFNAPDGKLMLYYRFQGSGNGDGMIQEYDGSTGEWTPGLGRFISRSGLYSGVLSNNSTSRNPYLNGISYAGGRLHVSWGWRESSGGSQFNHDLSYAYSDDDGRTWSNSAGTSIGTTASSPVRIDSPGLRVATIPQDSGLSNDYTHYAYPDGSCHVILSHDVPGTTTRRYHHYWRNASGTWSVEVLPFSGSRPKLVGDDNGCLFLAHASNGRPTIAKGTPDTHRTSWSWAIIHTQSDTTEGGEGLVDDSRWQAERILSFYGQERPNAAGDPTPLHVFDYQVSGKAILPLPADMQTGVSPSTSLAWTPGIAAASHHIFLGTDREAVVAAGTSSPVFQGETTGPPFIPPGPLDEGTTYYWRIDQIDDEGALHTGLIWSFTTEDNEPPSILAIPDQTAAADTAILELPLVIDDDRTPPGSLTVSAISSHPDILEDTAIFITGSGSERLLALHPQPGAVGSTTITVRVGDGTHIVEESFLLTVTGHVHELHSLAQDASIREIPDVVDIDASTTLMGTGGTSPRVDRCTVYVFRLPDLGPHPEPFSEVSFSFHLAGKQGTLQGADLYGLPRRTLADVLAGDYYGKTSEVDPAATLVQPDILTDSTSLGAIQTSSAGSTELKHYLNAQYASGVGAGDYVFLRLNSAGYRDKIDRATLTMSEGADPATPDTQPRITLTLGSPTSLQAWRSSHFGSPFNEGLGADDSDPDSDGESNLLEFATAQSPAAGTRAALSLEWTGAAWEFRYPRSVAAAADGLHFIAEWSDSLQPGSWRRDGITETIRSDDGSVQLIAARLPSTPDAKRFVRLVIEHP